MMFESRRFLAWATALPDTPWIFGIVADTVAEYEGNSFNVALRFGPLALGVAILTSWGEA